MSPFTGRPRRALHQMPTRHNTNRNWSRRGDNTKSKAKK